MRFCVFHVVFNHANGRALWNSFLIGDSLCGAISFEIRRSLGLKELAYKSHIWK